MTTTPRLSPAAFAVVLLGCLVGGCGAPSAPERFYALGNGGALVTRPLETRSTDAVDAPGIVISAVTVPELVDRPQIVTRDANQRVFVSEGHLWAESVKAGIARTLALRLSRTLADAGRAAQVAAYPQNSIQKPAMRITVDIARFDAVPNGSAIVDAVWSVRRVDDQVVRSGRTVAASPVEGDGYGAIVDALDASLVVVDRDIATAVIDLGLPAVRPR